MPEMKTIKSARETARSDKTERRYQAEVKAVKAKMKRRVHAIRESRRLSDRDLQIVINARG